MVVNEGDYNVSIYQREPPEVVVDFNLLPGVSSSGEHTGFRSLKVDDDTFGDVDPPHFLGDFLGKVYYRRVDADTQYTAFGTESVNARENWFRQIQILGGTNNLDITRFASEARFEVAENGTFWNWDDDLWDLIPGVNYTLRVRGRNPLLFKFTYLITPARTENDGSSPGSDEGVIIGIDRNQPPYVNIPPERIVPQYLKAQEINLFFSFESGVQDCAIGIGSTENVPQSYWYAYELLDYNYEDRVDNYLYNNIGDDPVIKSNIWLRRNNTLPWIQDVQTRLNIYADSNTVSTKQQEQVGHRRYAYKFTPERVGMSFGYRKSLTPFGQLTVPEYRNREIIGLYINEFYNTFVLVMKRNDLLNTAVRELFIPEINYRIKMADMTFDNTTLDDRTIWTSKVVPELEEGEEYAVWLWD